MLLLLRLGLFNCVPQAIKSPSHILTRSFSLALSLPPLFLSLFIFLSRCRSRSRLRSHSHCWPQWLDLHLTLAFLYFRTCLCPRSFPCSLSLSLSLSHSLAVLSLSLSHSAGVSLVSMRARSLFLPLVPTLSILLALTAAVANEHSLPRYLSRAYALSLSLSLTRTRTCAQSRASDGERSTNARGLDTTHSTTLHLDTSHSTLVHSHKTPHTREVLQPQDTPQTRERKQDDTGFSSRHRSKAAPTTLAPQPPTNVHSDLLLAAAYAAEETRADEMACQLAPNQLAPNALPPPPAGAIGAGETIRGMRDEMDLKALPSVLSVHEHEGHVYAYASTHGYASIATPAPSTGSSNETHLSCTPGGGECYPPTLPCSRKTVLQDTIRRQCCNIQSKDTSCTYNQNKHLSRRRQCLY